MTPLITLVCVGLIFTHMAAFYRGRVSGLRWCAKTLFQPENKK